jgi:alpha-L-rhamnosidase
MTDLHSRYSRRQLLAAARSVAIAPALANISPLGWGEATPAPQAAEPFAGTSEQHRWLTIAESLKPTLNESPQPPISIVRPAKDPKEYLRWRMDIEAPGSDLPKRLLRKNDQFILDFGGHRTGHLQFRLVGEGVSVDSPCRLKLTFGEVPGDVAEPLYPYHGQLSSAWLPEEIITVDFLPQLVRMPRRYAFRYVKVEVIDTSPNYGVRFLDTQAIALTSATAAPKPLPETVAPWVRRVDEASTATLRDCMQTTFEDGPRRDQRLWIGDLRLQARASFVTYPNHDLVKRCLYLFAALPRLSDGFLPACVFEKPTPVTTGTFILDYAALYGAILLDYVRATRDRATAVDLFPVALRQLELLLVNLDDKGIFIVPKGSWAFIDWNRSLDRAAAIQGVMIYSCQRLVELAAITGNSAQAARYPSLIKKMTAAARDTFYRPQLKVCVSGPDDQVSWASQAWLTLAGCLTQPEAQAALRKAVLEDKKAIQPATAYLYHHVAEAMIECGMRKEALDLIKSYWGLMVEDGADTFWEAFDPNDSLFSPYGDIHINSFCHAWSGTPAYFFRALLLTE